VYDLIVIIIILIIIKTAEQRTKIQQYGDYYTLAVVAWAVTFGIARRGLGGLQPRSALSSLYQM